jgi:tetratricopeptide (TPR) repeat protein
MKNKLILLFLCVVHTGSYAQKQKADSLENLLAIEKSDTGKVKFMWQLAGVINVYDPERALLVSQRALTLATRIKYAEGESKSLGAIANTLINMGNYPKALEYNLKKLQLEEKRDNPRSLAFAMLNTGIVYRYQEQYEDALVYYYRADSVFRKYGIEDAKYYVFMNLGDAYDRMNKTDSAFSYFNKSLIISSSLKNDDYIGNSMTGLGHTYFKQNNYPFALLNYRTAITHLEIANDDIVLCEATLGLATLFQKQNLSDSAAFYANRSLSIALKDGFLEKQLEATVFLANHYEGIKNTDSAFAYLKKVQVLNDSVNSRSKIREIQMISGNERLRQLEIEENKKIAQRERKQQLQYLFIGIFIPGFFLLTLLLSRIRIHARVIKILGILSLLILFEYLTLLLHPTVAELTHHTPVYEMLIFVSLAAVLIPGHHRIEQWLIQKLIHRNGSIRMKKLKLKVKNPPV